MSDKKEVLHDADDPELNELLDSALEDFSKQTKQTSTINKADMSSSDSVPLNNMSETLLEETWTKDFFMQAADQFGRNLQNIMEKQGEVGTSVEKIAESVTNAITDGDGNSSNADFQTAVAQALKDLSASAENMQNASEADLAAMLAQTTLEEGGSDMLSFMQGMMQTLLSKEVLYPSLKELMDKYPSWLEEKKGTLSTEDVQRYEKQLDLMRKVCSELEKEKGDDSDRIKKERFEIILSLMQEMQNCGQPPEELIGEQAPLFQFDTDGNPIIPNLPGGLEAPQNCSIM